MGGSQSNHTDTVRTLKLHKERPESTTRFKLLHRPLLWFHWTKTLNHKKSVATIEHLHLSAWLTECKQMIKLKLCFFLEHFFVIVISKSVLRSIKWITQHVDVLLQILSFFAVDFKKPFKNLSLFIIFHFNLFELGAKWGAICSWYNKEFQKFQTTCTSILALLWIEISYPT